MTESRLTSSPAKSLPRLCRPLACATVLAMACVGAVQAQSAPAATPALKPPPGTMMGAYGQSLSQAAAAPASPTATPPSAQVPAAAGTGNAGDAVSRFLQEKGLLGNSGSGMLSQVRDKASDLVLSAMNFLGVPYKRGGTSQDNGFDCGGFTRHIFEMSLGLVLPHRADEQARLSSLVPIQREELKPGDLVFFNTMRRTFSHVGIYVGEGKFIHAPRTGSAVRVEDMRESYWAKRFTGARRADLGAIDASLVERASR